MSIRQLTELHQAGTFVKASDQAWGSGSTTLVKSDSPAVCRLAHNLESSDDLAPICGPKDNPFQASARYDGFDLMGPHSDYDRMKRYYLNRLKLRPLRPADLTTLQLRLLKENEWAQMAFLSTFALSVVDNPLTMANVRSLNIAELSGAQLSLLDRKDFWAALPILAHLTLMGSPDWREIPCAPSFPLDKHEEQKVQPSLASERFGALLLHQVQNKSSLTSLRLGFVGGGEHAPGLFARNRSILPAPVLPSNGNFDDVLLLPFVARLVFVNCWMPATALVRFVKNMGRHSLEHLGMESFSLLAFDGHSTTAPFLQLAVELREPAIWLLGKRYSNYLVPFPNIADAQALRMEDGVSLGTRVKRYMTPEDYLKKGPMSGTWGSVLQKLMPRSVPGASPSAVPGCSPEPDIVRLSESPKPIPSALQTIDLVSCGYVKLRHQKLVPEFDIHDDDQATLSSRMADRRAVLKPMMMKSDDAFLGQVIPKCIAAEQTLLKMVYDLEVGWQDKAASLACCEDDQEEGGSGRFTGTVKAR